MKQLVTYKGHSIRLSADFPSETWEVRKQWFNIFKCKTNKQKVSSKNPVSGKTVLQEGGRGTSLVVKWLRLRASKAGGCRFDPLSGN